MSFVKQTGAKGTFLPMSSLVLGGFQEGDEAILDTAPGMVLLTHRHMTAVQMVDTINSLCQIAAELTVKLSDACGFCEDCEDGCPIPTLPGDNVTVPDDLRRKLGVSEDAKLCAEVNREDGCIVIYPAPCQHDIRDVPEAILSVLMEAGACLGELSRHLEDEDVIYHG